MVFPLIQSTNRNFPSPSLFNGFVMEKMKRLVVEKGMTHFHIDDWVFYRPWGCLFGLMPPVS